MANILDLNAETRQTIGTASVRRLRREGLVPGVLYGSKTENANLKVNAKSVTAILKDSASENVLVNLQIDGAKTQLALIQTIQHDYLKGGMLHIDFHAVDMNESIHAQVPLELVGESEGVKAGGQLDIFMHNIEVFCLPKDLPTKLELDITTLGVGTAFHVRDLKLPAGVEVHVDGDVVVLAINEPRVEADPAAAAAAAKK